MNTKLSLSFITLLCIAACSPRHTSLSGQSSQPSDIPQEEKSYCFSDYENELMAHINMPAFHKGKIYMIYQSDCAAYHEVLDNTTNGISLSITDLCDLSKHKFIRVFNVGDCGGMTFAQSIQPYDPFLDFIDDTAYIIASVIPTDSGKETIAYRTFNPDTEELSDCALCTLDGEAFTIDRIGSSYAKYTGCSPDFRQLSFNSKAYRFSDGCFYSIVGAYGAGFDGLIVRSPDLVHWESVSAKKQFDGNGVWNSGLFEISNGKMLLTMRVNGQGIYKGTYDIANNVWSPFTKIPGTLEARPFIFKYNDKTYMACNIEGSMYTEGYGTIARASLGVFEISDDLSLNLVYTKKRRNGINYPTFLNIYSDLYIIYTTDDRYINDIQVPCNNINCEKVNLKEFM